MKNPIEGRYYDWPVGFVVGQNLSDYWQLEDHTLGQLTFTHFPDGTAHKNRMQGNDFVQSVMYNHRVTCFSCHDAHGTDNNALLLKPANEMCLQCHGPDSPNGPRATTMAQHTHHEPGSAGNECVNCHMPRIEQTIADVNLRSHTFRFIAPAEAERLKMSNSCNTCHRDKDATWATNALKHWQNEVASDILRVNGGQIDLILLNMTIPGASSHEVAAVAAQVRPDLKLVLTSAYGEEIARTTTSAMQTCSFIRKPFQLGVLVQTLQNVLRPVG